MEADFQADITTIPNFDAVPTILDVVCRTTGMGFAAVARVTEERWIACKVLDNINFGLKAGSELKIESTICHEIRRSRKPVIIDHVSENRTYRDHHTPATYGFQSYISMPIILANGRFFGTLCAIDPHPARVNTPEIIGMFTLFAQLIAYHLDAAEKLEQSQKNLAASQENLKEEKENSVLRDQFIAVLGHDLRNPLGAISTGAQLLERLPLTERGASVTALIKESATRMLGLIEDVLDFARGKMGGGIIVQRDASEPLEPVLKQVVAELRSTNPAREIIAEFNISRPLNCDRRRIGQLFSNLLGNAVSHGTADKPIKVRAETAHDYFELSVANSAKQITPAVMERLFNPFCRGEVMPKHEGLGLGLYIAFEIAKAHGGIIDVTSTEVETCFTFRMPLAADGVSAQALKKHAAVA